MGADFDAMTGPQLAAAYNEMIVKADSVRQNDFMNVKKFRTREDGIRRCQQIERFLEVGPSEDQMGSKKAEELGLKPSKEETKQEAKQTSGESSPAEMVQGSDDMAKKAKKKVTGRKAAEEMAREGTNKARLVKRLKDSLGSQVTIARLTSATYGSDTKKNRAKLKNVVKGVEKAASRHNLKVVHEGRGEELTIGLHSKK